jgi:hypothetical protein
MIGPVEASLEATLKRNAWIVGWDVLFAGLVLFPWLTGGVWLEKPGAGIVLELSDLAIPVLGVGLLGLALRALGQPLEQSFFVRGFQKAFAAWKAQLEKTPSASLWTAASAVSVIWFWAACNRNANLQSNAFDMGIFTNTLWNVVHGHGYQTSLKGGGSLFADHQSPILLAFVPLFALIPSPETLLAAQALILASGGVACFYLARQHLPRGHWAVAAVPLVYWNSLPIRNANAFDFHPEVAMLPLFLAGIAGLQSRAPRAIWGGALALAAALACKESAGPVAAGIGLAWCLGAGPPAVRARTRALGAGLIIAGTAAFAFDVRAVPKLLGVSYAYDGLYDEFGGKLVDLILAPALHPALFLAHLAGRARLEFSLRTLGPLGFLPLLDPVAFVSAIPGYLMLYLSKGDHRVNLIFHYAVELSPGLFWALPRAIARIRWRGLAPWLAFWCVALSGRSEPFRIRHEWMSPHARYFAGEIVPRVDATVALTASGALVPHLAKREWVERIPNAERSGAPVPCILYDEAVQNWPLDDWTERMAWVKALPARGYREEYSCGSIKMYRHASAAGDCFTSRPSCSE